MSGAPEAAAIEPLQIGLINAGRLGKELVVSGIERGRKASAAL